MEIFVSGAGFKGAVKSICLAELGYMVTGIGVHTKGIIEYDSLLRKTRMIPDRPSNLIQQNIERRKPPNQKYNRIIGWK
ncbi:hypothetical protein [Bacillus sp. X1(2014)]|uniref:hypothetical protein n=1 Tax=Bacillus sp. X1(2014) TaxID=1565991 RepID=UPI0011A3756C|nr:hypothetical protein [Bacillus sp. X1(2014)]